MKLSYRFSSFTAADNAEVLCSQDHFRTMIVRAKEYLMGMRKVRGGREFCVHLDPAFKQPPPTTAEASSSKKVVGKKGKSKAKVAEEDEDEKTEESIKKDKLMAVLAAEHHCEVKEHRMGCCWVQNDGQHIPLECKDLSSWALWIVSCLCLFEVFLLMDAYNLIRVGGKPPYVSCWRH